jgi:hypothetical protein
MLATINRPQFISRVFTDRYGRNFRLTFFVSVVDGQVKGRLVSAEPLKRSVQLFIRGEHSECSCLPISFDLKKASTEYVSAYVPVVSPYTSLIYSISQPTRAPSGK